ncbi:MAG: right-handed parallel beta-helix repeat-containing protein [Saprospiraceae bacterium]
MKKLLFLSLSTALMAVFMFTACQKDKVEAVSDTQQQVTEETNYYTPNLGDFVTSRSGYWTEIPAGSVDALNQAIADADAGGVIYLKAGMHTETGRVTVNKRVAIIGEDGAVLRVSSPDTTAEVNPGLHVLNAPGTLVKNLVIEPIEAISGCGIMFENSPQSAVLNSDISKFKWGVLVEKSDRMAIIGNHFQGCTANAILVNNGKSAYIGNNEIEGTADSGIWACDEWGTMENNHFHDNASGALLCNWSVVFEVLTPSGEPLGAIKTCIGWKLRNNKFTGNYLEGGLKIRDSAHLNLIESNNEFSDNFPYDIWIPADEDFLPIIYIPAAYKNTIYATPDVLIKDCGVDNVINGGTMVDTSVDPC